jgi:hypothetical protein
MNYRTQDELLDQPQFRNKICKECIKKNIQKYGSFECQCKGITVETDVKNAIKQGYDEHTSRYLFDTAYFFEFIYGHKPRWYQYRLLYCTSRRLVARQCRQTGKTLLFMYKIFQYIITNSDVQVIIFLPTEKQIKEMWDKYVNRDFINKSEEIANSVEAKTMSPSYEVRFTNGSKITLAIPSASSRGFTANWIYIDEAALVPKEALNAILMTIASKDDYSIFMTSTPFGRGNAFYNECKDSPNSNEYHITIYEVEEMKDKITFFKELLGETGFIQECEAEFPDTAGGPFNYKGIDLSKADYRYKDIGRVPGWIYIGGVDWNGPGIGTYFCILGFNPDTYQVRVFDFQIIASANWNGTAAKEMFRILNEKWRPKHWMVDSGYGQFLSEDLILLSTHAKKGTADADIKHSLERIEFSSFTEIEDPFTKEPIKKMTKNLMVSQFAKLFEIRDGRVSFQYSKYHEELTKSLESYKLLSITDKGIEKYGFEKKDDIEDHCYTPNHEFLTRKGWKAVSLINENDELATPDEFGLLRYERPSRVIKKKYSGKIYHISTNDISFSVTDQHLIPYIVKTDYKQHLTRALVPDLPGVLVNRSSVTGLYDSEDYDVSDEYIYNKGFFCASGFTPLSTKLNKIGYETIKQHSDIQDESFSYVEQPIHRKLLENLSKRQLQILLSGIINGKGLTHTGDAEATIVKSKSREFANNVHEICVLVGLKSTFSEPNKKAPYWEVKYYNGVSTYEFRKNNIKEDYYAGMVYCATVSSGLLVVRRDGKVHIGSNCIDSVMCAVHGITKYYSELFKRIAYGSVLFSGKEVLTPPNDENQLKIPYGASVTLITNSHSQPIELDEGIFKEVKEDKSYISRTFDKAMMKTRPGSIRNRPLVKRTNPFIEGTNGDNSFSRRTSFF